jgi:REP element-mobilizing transposase RayT
MVATAYPYVGLDEWGVMPNHLHGIIIINDNRRMGGSRTAPTANVRPLGGLIGAFKTVSTKRVRQEYGSYTGPLWQRSYYEHVIRDDADLLRIRQYIINNPACWDTDEENPGNSW